MRKLLVSGIVAGAIALSPVLAMAETATSSSVQNMLSQIQALQTQIKAMQDLQNQLKVSQENVQTSLGLLRNLKQGMSGDDVKALQAILASDPSIFPSGQITGFFGPSTAQAVKKFQKKNGLEQVGNVGPRTLNKLNEELGRLGLRQDAENATSTERDEKRGSTLCVPPGHMIAPGWLRKNEENEGDQERGRGKGRGKGEMDKNRIMLQASTTNSIIPPCKSLPPGIKDKLEGGWIHGTSTPPVDNTAPVISSIVSTPASTTANVTWTTNENSNSKIWYGTSTPISTATAPNIATSSLVTSHIINLSGLSTSTTYYFVVGSTDSSNNTSTSSQRSFVTTSGI